MSILFFLLVLAPAIYLALTITMYSVHTYKANQALAISDFKPENEYEYDFTLGNTGVQKASFVLNIAMIITLLLTFPLFYVFGFIAVALPIAIAIVESYIVYSPRKVLLEQYGKKVRKEQTSILTTQKVIRWTLLGLSVLALLAFPLNFLGVSISSISELINQF